MSKENSSRVANNHNVSSLIRDLTQLSETYPPLKPKEELELIKKYKKNRDELNQRLILHNIRLVFMLSNKYKGTCIDYDEMIQSALHGLTIAASKFNINGTTKFSTYAAFWIRKYVLSPYYSKYNTEIRNHSLSLDMPYSSDEHSSMGDFITSSINDADYIPPTPDKISASHDMTTMYSKLVDYVDAKFESVDKKIFKWYFLENKTLTEIAKKVGKSVPLIQYRKTKIINTLKKELKHTYDITSLNDI